MINKRYLKYTLLLFTFGMTACSDFLDEVNHSSQSADKYYQTKGGYESLIVGCYSNLKISIIRLLIRYLHNKVRMFSHRIIRRK